MASYRKRGPRQWQAQVRKKGYPLQTRTFKSKAAAETWVRSIEYEMDQGVFVSRHEAETTTLGELLERYRREYTVRKRGRESESCRINTLLRHDLAQRYVGSLRGVDIARYRDERLQAISPGSLRRELTILSQVYEIARKEWGIFVHNPVREVKLPPNNRPRDRRLVSSHDPAEDEESRLLAACRACRNPFLLPVVRLRRRPVRSFPCSPSNAAAACAIFMAMLSIRYRPHHRDRRERRMPSSGQEVLAATFACS